MGQNTIWDQGDPTPGSPRSTAPDCKLYSTLQTHARLHSVFWLNILVLFPWFPTPEERSFILHYCAHAAQLMMAIPSGLNPMLAINLPLALSYPRGCNAASDALRVALLAVGAVHQAFLLSRSGTITAQSTEMYHLASAIRVMGKQMVGRAAADPITMRSEATLGAAATLALVDMLFGGHDWEPNFNLARSIVFA